MKFYGSYRYFKLERFQISRFPERFWMHSTKFLVCFGPPDIICTYMCKGSVISRLIKHRVPLEDNITLACSSQITTCMLNTLCPMYFSCVLSFIVHRMLDGYYSSIDLIQNAEVK